MGILSVTNLKKEFDEVVILEQVSFEVQETQRVGLVGRNGSGKTTLFKLISGAYEPDEGSIAIPERVKIGVLEQIPEYPDAMTVEEVLRSAFAELHAVQKRLSELERAMAAGDAATMREYGALSTAFEASGGYSMDVELKRVANGLKIDQDMLGKSFNLLSGGERTKINLGRMILMNVDLMLLDEPTNHLDMQSVEWLEEFLKSYKGTVLIISHDRYFLDSTVNRIIEIENQKTVLWEGNYSAYVRQKEEWIESAENRIRQDERKIDQLEFTIRRLHGMGTEKMHRKAFSMEKRIERMRKEMPVVIKQGKNMRAVFSAAPRSGEDVLTIRGLKKSFGSRVLFSDVHLGIKKDDRIALIGSNGTGKTTLLKILIGEEMFDAGKIRWGEGVRRAYLPQLVEFEDGRMTVLDYLLSELNLSPAQARNRLGSFHFVGDDVFKLVRELSGGEKSRLKLCALMYQGVNLLILDEPTNHLDIRSAEWIEEAIEQYEGTLLLISHDRYFLSKFAERIWSLEDGSILDFNGNYEEFKQFRAKLEEQKEARPLQTVSPKREQPKSRSREQDVARRKIPIIEREIEKAEEGMRELDAEIDASSSDHIRLQELIEQRGKQTEELDRLLAEWEQLHRICET